MITNYVIRTGQEKMLAGVGGTGNSNDTQLYTQIYAQINAHLSFIVLKYGFSSERCM